MHSKHLCECEPCRKRRAQAQRWYERHRETRLKQNAESKKRNKGKNQRFELTDEEMDRRALESMPWRKQA